MIHLRIGESCLALLGLPVWYTAFQIFSRGQGECPVLSEQQFKPEDILFITTGKSTKPSYDRLELSGT